MDNNTTKGQEVKTENKEKVDFPRTAFSRLLTQRFFLTQSFEVYGGVTGLYDLGPPGTAIKANLLSLWRNHFVLNENMLEVDCSSVTPEPVLITSGHVAKFADLMVKDLETGSCYRADHLLEQHLETLLTQKGITPQLEEEYKLVMAQADAYTPKEMAQVMKKYGVKSPEAGHELSDPEFFNLMFQTQIGPTGQYKGYLRPETAQGIFVNFKRLLEFNGGKLPFAAAQIGQAYRNEIAPRNGLLRVREFTLAEIEHFVNPKDKSHPKFADVSSLVVTLFPRDAQMTTLKTVEMTIGKAVESNIINNETLGYFIGRTHLFLLAAGIKRDRLRFRQHLTKQMAHYASDCWDAEIRNSYGWTECVGIADRSAFDLTEHSRATKVPLSAFVEFSTGPREVESVQVKLDKGKIGKTYKDKAQILIKELSEMDSEKAKSLEGQLKTSPVTLTIGNNSFEVTKDIVSFENAKKRVIGEHIIPGVIEPSFGIGRILYSILEHNYYTREGSEQRAVLSLPPQIAPVKVSVLPLISSPELLAFVPKISTLLNLSGISHKVDDIGATIGKRYARTDEIGIPFGITIDKQTVSDSTVTLRERDSMAQIRIPIADIPSLIQSIVFGASSWKDACEKYPKLESTKEQE